MRPVESAYAQPITGGRPVNENSDYGRITSEHVERSQPAVHRMTSASARYTPYPLPSSNIRSILFDSSLDQPRPETSTADEATLRGYPPASRPENGVRFKMQKPAVLTRAEEPQLDRIQSEDDEWSTVIFNSNLKKTKVMTYRPLARKGETQLEDIPAAYSSVAPRGRPKTKMIKAAGTFKLPGHGSPTKTSSGRETKASTAVGRDAVPSTSQQNRGGPRITLFQPPPLASVDERNEDIRPEPKEGGFKLKSAPGEAVEDCVSLRFA